MAEHGVLFSKTRRQLQGRRGITLHCQTAHRHVGLFKSHNIYVSFHLTARPGATR